MDPKTGAPSPPQNGPRAAGHSVKQIGWLLAWAVVFCDIGTSVYYTPGILYHHVGNLAPYFILLTTVGFLLLAQKYGEVSWRNPEGGGVVTVARKAFGSWWGALGGILITIDYFLTSSISSVSGFAYLASIFPPSRPTSPCCRASGSGCSACSTSSASGRAPPSPWSWRSPRSWRISPWSSLPWPGCHSGRPARAGASGGQFQGASVAVDPHRFRRELARLLGAGDHQPALAGDGAAAEEDRAAP